MTKLQRLLGISIVLASAITISGCKHHYKGYYWNKWKPRFSSGSHSSGNIQNTSSYTQPSYQPDPFYAQQAAKREANMRAVQAQQQKNDLYNYQHGYTNKLPR